MEVLKRDEFKKLLEDNPGKKYAFYHYVPCTFLGDVHITTGAMKGSSFKFWSPDPILKDENPDFGSLCTLDLLEDYEEGDMFAVLDDSDIMFMLLWLKTVTGDAKTPNELRIEEGLPQVEDTPATKQKKVKYKVVRSCNPACNTSYSDLEKAFEDGWQFVRRVIISRKIVHVPDTSSIFYVKRWKNESII